MKSIQLPVRNCDVQLPHDSDGEASLAPRRVRIHDIMQSTKSRQQDSFWTTAMATTRGEIHLQEADARGPGKFPVIGVRKFDYLRPQNHQTSVRKFGYLRLALVC